MGHTMTRCTFNRSVTFWMLLLISLAASQSANAESPRPNVVLIFADDQRADTIAALGNPVIKTPHLDRLVRRGLSFRRAYMQGAMQGATCVPSRAMLLSGQNLFHIDERLQRDKTWPEAFAEAGYRTFVSGKWHNGEASLLRCFPQARSVFTGGMTNPLQAKLRTAINGKLGQPALSQKHACETFTDEVIGFIQQQAQANDSDQPFFAYLPFDGPHDPHIVPESFELSYSPDAIPLPANFMAEHPWENGELDIRDEKLLPRPRQAKDIQQMLADYYRYISFLDGQVGRVLDEVDRSPFATNTIIVFTADSGVARGSHGLIGKQNLYEHSIRIPLVIAGPGIAKDQTTDALCYLFDLLPTLGKRCSIAPPNASDAMDLNHLLSDPSAAGRNELIFAYRDVQHAYMTAQWKLIHYPKADRLQCFDLQDDPHEIKNLADESQYQSLVGELQGKMGMLMRSARH